MMAVNVPINFFADVGDAANEFKKLSTVLKTVGAAFAVNKIVDGLQFITSAAAEAEAANQRMRSALRLAGDFSEQNAAKFQRLADEIERTSKFDGELVLSSVALAKQFGATNAEAEKLIRAATNLAAATGVDLVDATRSLGQTLDGTSGRLAEQVPELRKLTAEQLKAGAAIDIVAERFKGAAESELQTFGGALQQLQNSFGDIFEELGKAIVQNDDFRASIKGLQIIFVALKDIIVENQDVLSSLVSGGINIALRSFAALLSIVQALQVAFEALIIGFKTSANVFVALPKLIANAFKGATEANRNLIDAIKEEAKVAQQSGQSRINLTTKFINSVQNAADKISESKNNQNQLTNAVRATGDSFDKQKPKIDRFALSIEESKKKAEEQRKAIEEAQKAEEKRMEAQIKRFEQLRKFTTNPLEGVFAESNLAGLSDGVQNAVARGLGAIGLIAKGKEGAKQLLSSAVEGIGVALTGVPGFGALFDILAQGPDKVREFVREFAKAIPDIVVAVVEATPVLIEEIVDAIPMIIEKLAERAPDIAIAIARAVAITLPIALVKATTGIFARQFELLRKAFTGIFDGIGDVFAKLIDEIGKSVGKIFENLNPFRGGANGGIFGNFLGPVGSIIDSIFGGGGGGGGGGGMPGRGGGNPNPYQPRRGGGNQFGRKGGGGSGAEQLIIPVQIDRKEIASVMVDLSKYGYRLEFA